MSGRKPKGGAPHDESTAESLFIGPGKNKKGGNNVKNLNRKIEVPRSKSFAPGPGRRTI